MPKQHRLNNDIHGVPEVMVIGADNEQLGVMPIAKALQMADDMEVDLVEVAPSADPPVCRLLDYGKLQYRQAKKDKGNHSQSEMHEIRLRPNIGDNDLDIKIKKIREFIVGGSRVKVTVRFKGREVAHQGLGMDVLRKIGTVLKDDVRLESKPVNEGRMITVTLIPAVKK